MEILNPQFNLDSFFNNLGNADKRALMLDYDGTLAPFRVEREKAVPYPGVCDILSRLISVGRTRIIIVSGRRVNDVVALLNLEITPEIWGSHGAEQLTSDNKYRMVELTPAARQGLAQADIWIEEKGLAGVIEKKPSGVAFHWRGMKQDEAYRLKEMIRKRWLSAVQDYSLVLQEFNGGLELRAVGITKGNVVESIITEMGAKAVLAYLGDDLTDEDAFRALHSRGLGVLVHDSRRETAADIWIKPPQELLQFLERWIEYGG